jgi:hypothetical protein
MNNNAYIRKVCTSPYQEAFRVISCFISVFLDPMNIREVDESESDAKKV